MEGAPSTLLMCPSAIRLDTQYILYFIFQTIEVASCDCCIIKIMSIIVLCKSDIEQITICHLRSYRNSYKIYCIYNQPT